MTFEDFKNSLEGNAPPANLNTLLYALWFDAKGNWEKSHDLVSEDHSKEAARIHAYLHRKEGDLWNADYWYKRAGETSQNISLEKEWQHLVERMLLKN